MTKLFVDSYHSKLSSEATIAYKAFISILNRRIANTTNQIPIKSNGNLYRIILGHLEHGIRPQDITIITFNQDLYIEKTLHFLNKNINKYGNLFNFPFLYKISELNNPTKPNGWKDDHYMLFQVGHKSEQSIDVLKLHGSLNWYSRHISKNINPDSLFKIDRKINATRRKKLTLDMTIKTKRKTMYSFPLIVPPINHKSGVIHHAIQPIWNIAEERLRESTEIMIFGYSCPTTDIESQNLLQRAMSNNVTLANVLVINPDKNVLLKYAKLINPKKLTFYPTAEDYFKYS